MDSEQEVVTVRHYDYELLVSDDVLSCSICKVYKRTLASKLVHRNKQPALRDITLSSHINNRHLHSPKLRVKVTLQQKCRRNMLKRIGLLKDKLSQAVQSEGVVLNDGDHEEMKSILNSEYSVIKKKYSPDSFERLFWEQQLKASNCTDPRQMRWHPTIIKWCLYIRCKSAGAYDALRDSGCHPSVHYATTHIALRHPQVFQMMSIKC